MKTFTKTDGEPVALSQFGVVGIENVREHRVVNKTGGLKSTPRYTRVIYNTYRVNLTAPYQEVLDWVRSTKELDAWVKP